MPHPLVDALSCAASSCPVDAPGCASVPIICHRCLAAGVVDTGVKFATGINDTSGIGGKFATGVVDTGNKFASVLVDTGGKFAAGVVDTGGAP